MYTLDDTLTLCDEIVLRCEAAAWLRAFIAAEHLRAILAEGLGETQAIKVV